MWKSALVLIVTSVLLVDRCSSVDENTTDSDKNMHLPYKCENNFFYLEFLMKSKLKVVCKSDNVGGIVKPSSNCNPNLKSTVNHLNFDKCIPDNESWISIVEYLDNLRTFNIIGDERNVIRNFSVIKNILPNNTSITLLSLVNLGLKYVEITGDIFPNLTTVILRGNKLTAFPQFPSGSKIHTLDLSDNDLTNLGEKFHCRNLEQLKKLNISGNKHFELSNARSFKGCDALSELQMANMGINKIYPNLWGLEYLELLDLSNNNITTILLNDIVIKEPLATSKGISIDLSHCGIENIYITSTLEYNRFSDKHLKMLDLSNNKLSVINETILGVLQQPGLVIEMKLDENPWTCKCDKATANFISFAKNNSKKIADIHHVRLCDSFVMNLDVNQACNPHVMFLVGGTTIGILVLVLGILFYRHRKNSH